MPDLTKGMLLTCDSASTKAFVCHLNEQMGGSGGFVIDELAGDPTHLFIDSGVGSGNHVMQHLHDELEKLNDKNAYVKLRE